VARIMAASIWSVPWGHIKVVVVVAIVAVAVVVVAVYTDLVP